MERTLQQGWSDWSERNRHGVAPVDTTDAWSRWRNNSQNQPPSLIQYL